MGYGYLRQSQVIAKKENITDIGFNGVQGRLLQNVALWHVEFFELKTIKVQQTQEELFISPSTA